MAVIANTQSSLPDLSDTAMHALFPNSEDNNGENNDFMTDLIRVGESQTVTSFSYALLKALINHMLQSEHENLCGIYGKAIRDIIGAKLVGVSSVCSNMCVGQIFKADFLRSKKKLNKKSEVNQFLLSFFYDILLSLLLNRYSLLSRDDMLALQISQRRFGFDISALRS